MQNVVVKCSGHTDANRLSESIKAASKDGNTVVLRVIGAGALNQAVKAVILANKFFIKGGVVLTLQPCFVTTEDKITAIEMKVIQGKI